jgi:hypothetical protein
VTDLAELLLAVSEDERPDEIGIGEGDLEFLRDETGTMRGVNSTSSEDDGVVGSEGVSSLSGWDIKARYIVVWECGGIVMLRRVAPALLDDDEDVDDEECGAILAVSWV